MSFGQHVRVIRVNEGGKSEPEHNPEGEILVEHRGFEPLTSSMPWKRSPS